MMTMIDVIFNALWIVGLALVFATWSYARFTAHRDHVKTRTKLNELTYALVLDLGLLLFVGGMAATESRWWGRALWVFIGLIVIVEAALRTHKARSDASED